MQTVTQAMAERRPTPSTITHLQLGHWSKAATVGLTSVQKLKLILRQ